MINVKRLEWFKNGGVEEQFECMNDITQMYEEIAKSIRRKLLERYSYLSDIVIH